jgi:hypothetical protein
MRMRTPIKGRQPTSDTSRLSQTGGTGIAALASAAPALQLAATNYDLHLSTTPAGASYHLRRQPSPCCMHTATPGDPS